MKKQTTVKRTVNIDVDVDVPVFNTDDSGPYDVYLGKNVFMMCLNYAYTGKCTGVNDHVIVLQHPYIVFETGPLDKKTWKNAERLPTAEARFRLEHIECIFETDK